MLVWGLGISHEKGDFTKLGTVLSHENEWYHFKIRNPQRTDSKLSSR